MKDRKLVEQKVNKKEGIYSPMRTLFKLTVNVKNSFNNSYEKRIKQLSSAIFNKKNNQLNNIYNYSNIYEFDNNPRTFRRIKQNHSLVDIKDKINNFYSNYINLSNDENDYNDIQNNEYDSEYNKIYNFKNNYNSKSIENSSKNKLNNNNKNEVKESNYEQIVNKSIKSKKIELKNNKNKNNRVKNNNNNGQIKEISGNDNFLLNNKINRKYQKNIKQNNNKNIINKNIHLPKKTTKYNIKAIEMPFINSEAKYNDIYSNNKLKNNIIIKTNKNRNVKILNKDRNNSMINNLPNETIQPEELYLKRYNLGNSKNIIGPNQNIIFNIKKQNIKKVNNILINTKNLPSNIIYSPKKGLLRVHSQENVVNKDIEAINSITENRLIYKNKSLKEVNGFTYTKKNNLQKTRNNISNSNKKDLIDSNLTNKNNNKYYYNSSNNINIFYNNNENLVTRRDEDYFDEKKYDIKPDIYPEIKINLRNKKKRQKNKSVIIENKYNINKSNIDIKDEDNNEKNYSNKKYYSIYHKSNDEDNKLNNNDKNISQSFLSNVSNPPIFSNSNISITNNTLSDIALMTNNNLTYIDKLISKDMYYILVLEEKIKDLADYSLKSENMEIIRSYCFELINFYFYYSMNKCIQKAIMDIIEINNIMIYNNYIIFSIIILYDLTSEEKIFNNAKILIKEILRLIYSNLILIINHSKNIINNTEENISILYHIINNIRSKYLYNKELYLDDNEYLLKDQDSHLSFEEKLDYNLNFIIRNIHTIINNIKKTKNFHNFFNLFKKLKNINSEDINQFYRDKILKINRINSSFLCSEILNTKNIIKAFPPYIANPTKKQYTLVISLDETLIHFKVLNIEDNKGVIQLRPGLIEFFDAIKPYYEIIVFSSSNKKYTDLIINSIDDKKKYIDHRLWRDHCIIISNDFVKDISRIGRPINKIVIVDNIPQNFRLHKENGIYIKSFYGDNSNDKILFSLNKILINIALNEGDIREGIKKYWNEIFNKVSSNIYNNYYNK